MNLMDNLMIHNYSLKNKLPLNESSLISKNKPITNRGNPRSHNFGENLNNTITKNNKTKFLGLFSSWFSGNHGNDSKVKTVNIQSTILKICHKSQEIQFDQVPKGLIKRKENPSRPRAPWE